MKKLETSQSIILIIIQRTLAFPFFFVIAFVGALRMFVKWIINFIRFGGESIAYTEKMNRKTIQDCFVKLNEMQKSERGVVNKNDLLLLVRLSCFREVWQKWCDTKTADEFDKWLHNKMHEA